MAWDIVSLVLNMDFSLGHIRGRQYRAVSVGRTGGTSGLIWTEIVCLIKRNAKEGTLRRDIYRAERAESHK